jgi:hypothetical protein
LFVTQTWLPLLPLLSLLDAVKEADDWGKFV